MKSVKNINDLNAELNRAFNELRKGELSIDQVKAISNLAGKIIGTVKVQIEYRRLMHSEEPINGLE